MVVITSYLDIVIPATRKLIKTQDFLAGIYFDLTYKFRVAPVLYKLSESILAGKFSDPNIILLARTKPVIKVVPLNRYNIYLVLWVFVNHT
jgi:hypothetical protein